MVRRFIAMALILALMMPAALAGGDITGFGLEWLKQTSMEGEENAVISPASAYFALVMAALGAEGETKAEICRALGEREDGLSESASALIKSMLAERGDTQLSIANSAWVDDRYQLNELYESALREALSAEAYGIDLSGDDAPGTINAWVKERTRGLIERVLYEPLKEAAALMLINTLYFKADWMYEFMPGFTYDGAFTADDGSIQTAEYMYKKAYLDYFAGDDGARGVVLPYEDGETSFIAILPPEGVSADAYLKTLDSQRVNGFLSGASNEYVSLSLPKVEVTCDYDMMEALKGMGINAAFDYKRADFSGMLANTSDDIYVSDVFQKVTMSIGEKGTEAAAVTVIEAMATSAQREPPVIDMTFDRSYLYMVIDARANAALFIGMVTHPDAM